MIDPAKAEHTEAVLTMIYDALGEIEKELERLRDAFHEVVSDDGWEQRALRLVEPSA